MVDKYFLEMFTEQIELNIEEYVGKKCTVRVDQQEKNNVTLNAVTITPEGSIVGTVLYVEPYYEASCNSITTQTIVKKALETIKKGIEDAPVVDMDMMRDYEQVKGRLSVDLMAAENNKRILKNVPHQMIEDMAAVYRINLECGAMSGTALITNQMLGHYGITQEQLHADAIHNAAIIKPVCITNLFELLKQSAPQELQDEWEMEEMLVDESLFVATVPDKTRGAGVLVYENFFEDATKILGGDFYILPASIHEVILAKERDDIGLSELKEMVKVVNNCEVEPEDRLTYSVYHYDSKNHIFEIGEKFEVRRLKEMAEQKATKESVLNDLKEKQRYVDSRSFVSKETRETVLRPRGGEVL